jgi:acyl-coenzyme A thioesterase 9
VYTAETSDIDTGSELCFTNAAIFASKPLRFLSLDQITFRLPVPIGAVLRLSSKVVHTTQPHQGPNGEARVHIMVRAEVEEVKTGVCPILFVNYVPGN